MQIFVSQGLPVVKITVFTINLFEYFELHSLTSLRSGAFPLKQSPYQWWSLLRRACSLHTKRGSEPLSREGTDRGKTYRFLYINVLGKKQGLAPEI